MIVDTEKMHKELVGLEAVASNIKSLTGYAKGDFAQNGFGQQVEVYDVCKGNIAFMWVDAGKAEVMQEDEFDAIFTKEENGTE